LLILPNLQGAGNDGTELLKSDDFGNWIRQQIRLLKQKVLETGKELNRCRQEQVEI